MVMWESPGGVVHKGIKGSRCTRPTQLQAAFSSQVRHVPQADKACEPNLRKSDLV